jgi:uncharacterized lipoprotein
MTHTIRALRTCTIWLLSVAALGACSARNCGAGTPYLEMSEPPTFIIPEDVNLNPPSPAYRIPDGGLQDVVLTREYVDEDGETQVSCLTEPPRLIAGPPI